MVNYEKPATILLRLIRHAILSSRPPLIVEKIASKLRSLKQCATRNELAIEEPPVNSFINFNFSALPYKQTTEQISDEYFVQREFKPVEYFLSAAKSG